MEFSVQLVDYLQPAPQYFTFQFEVVPDCEGSVITYDTLNPIVWNVAPLETQQSQVIDAKFDHEENGVYNDYCGRLLFEVLPGPAAPDDYLALEVTDWTLTLAPRFCLPSASGLTACALTSRTTQLRS